MTAVAGHLLVDLHEVWASILRMLEIRGIAQNTVRGRVIAEPVKFQAAALVVLDEHTFGAESNR